MRKHPIRKFFGLTVLYAAIIVGIFILQFKTESVIQKTLGIMRISLAQTQTENNEIELKNQFQVTFNGISFRADQKTPIIVSNSAEKSNSKNLTLVSWKEINDLSAEFMFDDGSSLTFEQLGTEANPALKISALPSNGYDTLTLPWQSSGSKIKEETATRLLLSGKNSMYALNAPFLEKDRIVLSGPSALATYTFYDPAKHFEFKLAASLEGTEKSRYEENLKTLKSNLISKFEGTANSSQAASISEKEVIAYVAEMASQDRYNKALDMVPASFKQSNKRTYLSAPYFDNIINMDKTLDIKSQNYESMVQSAISNSNADIFTVEGIEEYILRQKKKESIKALLAIPSLAEKFEPTLLQADGIVGIYNYLYAKSPEIAALLESAIEDCKESIQKNISLEEGLLTVTDNDLPLSSTQAILLGQKLIELGSIQGNEACQATGRLLINQEMNKDLPLSDLAAVYHSLTKNSLYPHTEVLGYYGTEAVWSWTCASKMTYAMGPSSAVDLNIEFPLTYSHYVIIHGVPTFHANIIIQNLQFRSDPRFETYNSSGYVYNEGSRTLYLKSRHKSHVELIRLFCDPARNFKTL